MIDAIDGVVRDGGRWLKLRRKSGSGNLDSLRPHFLEDALPELGPRAEELLIGSGGRLVGILEGGQFHRADAVSNLAEPVVRERGQPVDRRVFREGVVDGLVGRLRDRLLPVVVVDLDNIEILKVRQLVEQKVDEALAHRGRDSVEIAVLLRLERDARVVCRRAAEEDPERREEPLPVGGTHVLAAVVAVQQRGGMERDVGQILLGERALIQANALERVFALLVEHEQEGQYLPLRLSPPDSSMNRPSSCNLASNTKKPGETPPALGSPPSEEPSFRRYYRQL